MDNPTIPLCDVCGKPATSAAIDIKRWSEPGSMYLQSEPYGRVKLGCDEHAPQTVIHDFSMCGF